MTIFKSKKLSLAGSKWAAMVLVVCFGIVALSGSPIHDHDLDSSHVDLDCISCHLVNANIGLDQDKQDLLVGGTKKTHSVSITTNLYASIVGTSSVFKPSPARNLLICFFI